ncbi:MAG: hypothetical protein CSA95_00225 [Bacteroidetes bacterium]|nr:MAG: hypothetical protein CSA95_00225 [Bacteroidota bacterium]
MKEVGTAHWQSPNTGATNESGFTALPGGCRDFFNSFLFVGSDGYWWSATERSSSDARYRYLLYFNAHASRSYENKSSGFSVRCVWDN